MGEGKRRGVAHLVEGLRGVISAHGILLPDSASSIARRSQRAAGRRIVAAAVDEPVEVERAGDVGKIRVMADEDEEGGRWALPSAPAMPAFRQPPVAWIEEREKSRSAACARAM